MALEDLYGRDRNLADDKEIFRYEISRKDFLKAIYDEMARRLDHDTFIFSGFKVHHELSEAGLSLRDENGKLKSYAAFEKDVTSIHEKYNRNYLRSEYNFAVASAQMAANWKEVEAGKNRYDLQYRTAGDYRVRRTHKALQDITLPADDPFWDKYYPPNGWSCRCTAVEVLKGKYPVSDSKDAIMKGEKATSSLDRFGNNKDAIFRFNPGKDGKIFPPKHPYLPKGCGECKKGIRNLAYDPDSEQCKVCLSIGPIYRYEENKAEYERLKNNPDYKDVVFDPETGGLKAVHKGHIIHGEKERTFFGDERLTSTDLEIESQNILFRNGYSCILENEMVFDPITKDQKTQLDSITNGMHMDIRSITIGEHKTVDNALKNKKKQLRKYNEENKTECDSLILHFHNPDHYDRNLIQSKVGKTFKKIICTINQNGGEVEAIEKVRAD